MDKNIRNKTIKMFLLLHKIKVEQNTMTFNNAFKEIRIEHGLKQKPNTLGTVYGVCETLRCPNGKKVGYYTGGFCKICSTRYEEDEKKPVIQGIIIKGGVMNIPNPEIRWVTKRWVKDLSDKLTDAERRAFYGSPEDWDKTLERLYHREQLEQDKEDYDVE